jgi:hypothetical protein
MTRKPNIQIGDRVAYSANWLRSTGMYVGELGFWRGTVTNMQTHGSKDFVLATVTWDKGKGPDEPSLILAANLAKVGTPAMSAN